jgi:hypothetical protein
VPVRLDTYEAGPALPIGYSVDLLTFAELADTSYGYSGFGGTPLGAYAIYNGPTLVEVRF